MSQPTSQPTITIGDITETESQFFDPTRNDGKKDPNAQPSQFTGSTTAPPATAPQFTVPPTEPPPVPGGGPGSQAPTVVNTDMMRLVASNLETLEQPLRDSISALDLVTVRAGALSLGTQLSTKVVGDGQLRDSTKQVLTSVLNTVMDTVSATRALATKFDTTEQLNGLSAADYNTYLNGVTSDVNSVLGSATPGK